MVAETQRNVIISLKLAADPNNQTTADLVSRQAKNVSVAGVNALRQEVEEFTRVEVGKTKIHEEQSNKRITKTLKEKEKREKAVQELAKKIREAEKTRDKSHQKANEAGLIAVQGLADMVEGAAKLGLITEDNFETFARHFEMIQSGIQVFKGATDAIWKTREGLIALSKATNAQTVANELMAASNVKAAGTGGVAAGSGAAAGGTVLGGAVIAGKATAVAAGVLAAGLALHDVSKLLLREMGILSENSELMNTALQDWWKVTKDLTESQKDLARAEQNQQALERERTKVEKLVTDRIDLQGQFRAGANRADEAVAFAAGESNIGQADRLRLEAIREVEAAEREIIEHRNLVALRKDAGRFQSEELAVKILKDLEDAQGRLLDADKNRLSVLRLQNQETEALLKAEQTKLITLEQAKQVEDQSLRARLGQFSPGLQRRTVEIAEKIKAGEQIDRRDVAILQEAGIGQRFVSDFFEKQGSGVAGSSTFTEVFGTKSQELKKAATNVSELQSELDKGRGQESGAKREVRSSAELFRQFNEVRVKQEAVLKQALDENFDGLNQENLIQRIQQAAADAADAINQQGMATINSIQTMQDTMIKSHQEMQKQFENFQLDTNWNQQT
ncbi:hypothetical protein [Gimesia aquarii]|uniref:Uncharacterized protein n=1 Tax=Gimesia aquarii TaxID=2527964 RepID=A0A517WNJ4_9PLAN|nr:hypothetical protein [Gimesia aquarii]QDU06836.1 hypothetical protein V202x_01790 [Gimesia aquarii]